MLVNAKKRWLSCCVVLFACRLAVAGDVNEAWRVEFESGALDGADKPVLINGQTREPEPNRLIFRSENNGIVLGGQFEEPGDYVLLEWPKLPNFALQKHPILEMRCKLPLSDADTYVRATPKFLTADNSEREFDFYVSRPQGEWHTVAFRIAGDEPLPETSRPVSLIGLKIHVHAKRTAEVEFDWMRLRQRNSEEQHLEEEWRSLVAGGPPDEPEVLSEFFPFGIYDDISDISRYPISHRHNFDVMSRNHLNYKQAAFAGPNIKAAEQTGVRISVRIRPILQRYLEGGVKSAKEWVRPYLDAVGDSPAVIGYDIGDERPLADLWPVTGCVQVLNQLDPNRFSSTCFFSPSHIPAYEPFLALYQCDIYPLGRGRNALYPHEWSLSLAKQTKNRRHWMILQTFGDTPYRKSGAHGGWILSTVAQHRLMTYGSIAGGVRGIIHYGYNWDGADTLMDQWCNPTGELFAEVSRLGELLIPIGRRLLDAEVDFETVVKSDNEDRLLVSVLHAPKRDVNYLVVVNKNIKESGSGILRLPAKWQGRKILDMASLNESNGELRISLAPGDGRIFMIGSTDQCQQEAKALQSNRIDETFRAMTPDFSTAESWKLDISEVLELKKRAFDFDSQLDEREASAREASDALKSLLAKTEPYASIRSQLDQIGGRMGKAQHAMYEDHRDAKTVSIMTPLRDSYWSLHAQWAESYSMLLEGKSEGLQARVEKLDADSKRISDEAEKALAGDLFYITNPTSLQKVLPKKGESGPPAERLRIAMCRGEFEPVQLVVNTGGEPLKEVRVAVGELSGPKGAVLEADRLEVNPMGFVDVESPTRGWTKLMGNKGGHVPDVLLPDRGMNVSAGSRQPFYITVRTLADDEPGEYRGQVRVTAAGRSPILVPLVVRVYDVVLPIKPHLDTAFGLCAGYRKIEGADSGADLETLIKYSKFLLKHRISPRVYGSDYEQTKVPPRQLKDGTWDFSGTDKFLSELVPLGLTTFYTHAGAGIPAYANHLKEKGWYDLAHVYMYDEAQMSKLPDLVEQYKHLASSVPGVKILQVGWSPTKALEDYVNLWCPLLSHADLDGLRRVRERGGESWWYTWDGPGSPYPNICHIDELGISARITGWMTYHYNIQGFLYWSVDVWNTNHNREPGPRLSVDEYDEANYSNWKANTYGKTTYGHPRNGDGYLIYPGKGNVPLASLRLAHTRDGFEDYDLFKEVEALAIQVGDSAKRAQELLEFSVPVENPIMISRTKWTKSDNNLLRRREEILKIAEEIRRPDDAVLRKLREIQTENVDALYPDKGKQKQEKKRAYGATPPGKARYVDGIDYDELVPRLETVDTLPKEGWLFKSDPESEGVKSQYFSADYPPDGMEPIEIGEFWDAQGHPELQEGWYRLDYECPTIPDDAKRVFLHFESVDESAWVYINGRLIGWYDTVYPSITWTRPVLIDVTNRLTGGKKHSLVIRVGNTIGAGGIYKPVKLMIESG
jgi:hypothetical protein